MKTIQAATGPVGLAEELAVFPLSGAVLLPGGILPLNVFEPRYLAMVDDALGQGRIIGMIQPAVGTEEGQESPPLCAVGCAGRITAFEETDDGRYLVTLTGVCRFRMIEELAPDGRPYRRVRADWDSYTGDLGPQAESELDRGRLLAALAAYFRRRGIEADWEAIQQAPDDRLVITLAMACPFAPAEKQALLEAASPQERARLLLVLIELSALSDEGESMARH